MVRDIFSIDEAERLIPSLQPLIRKAKVLKRRLEKYEGNTLRMLTDGSEISWSEDEGPLDAEFEHLKERFYTTVDRIEKSGCVLRSVDDGIVDFHTQFQGRTVCLSWRIGDETIKYWHEVDEDANSLKRIVDL